MTAGVDGVVAVAVAVEVVAVGPVDCESSAKVDSMRMSVSVSVFFSPSLLLLSFFPQSKAFSASPLPHTSCV
jgi:hypothetical protein